MIWLGLAALVGLVIWSGAVDVVGLVLIWTLIAGVVGIVAYGVGSTLGDRLGWRWASIHEDYHSILERVR